MPDLNEEIWSLKAEGKSLRQIAAVLGISHVAVLKKLRAIETKRQVVTDKEKQEPPLGVRKKDTSTASIPYLSMVCGESKDAGNQVVTEQPPSFGKERSVNSSGSPISASPEFPECDISGSIDDLFEAIMKLLKTHGVKPYRMQVSGEAYQVRYGQQTIRFYVDRKRYNPAGGELD